MTCLRVKRDLLISILYLASLPYVPVIESLSDPAKSAIIKVPNGVSDSLKVLIKHNA